MRVLSALVALAIAIALAACGDDDGGPTRTPGDSATATDGATPTDGATGGATQTGEPTAPPDLDCARNVASPAGPDPLTWNAILPQDIPAPEGYTVQRGEGEAPFLSVLQGGAAAGSVELLQFELPAGFDPQAGFAAITLWAEDFYANVRPEREAEGGLFEADDPAPAPFGTFCGASYGYTVTSEGGVIIERYAGYVTYDSAKLYLAVALFDAANPELGFRSADAIAGYEPGLAELVAALTVPAE